MQSNVRKNKAWSDSNIETTTSRCKPILVTMIDQNRKQTQTRFNIYLIHELRGEQEAL
jgi:hypothetical protein